MPFDIDKFLTQTYGFKPEKWEVAQRWLTGQLRQLAHNRETIYYGRLSDVLAQATEVVLDPHGTPFAGMLGQINVHEHDAGRPLLSAIVLLKNEERPGVGFWNIARDMGIAIRDPDQFWVTSLHECFNYWSSRTP
jgi:hypothetical protein